MTTKIPVELSSTPGIVDGSNATAITIDSSERVGVGTASPAQTLHTSGTGVQRIQIDATDNNAAGAGLFMKVLNSGSLVGNATVRVDNVGNIEFFNGTSSDSKKWTLGTNGHLKPAADGYGINFEAAKGAGESSTTLDDYEEGAWTPTILGSTTNPTISYAAQYGWYTKVGNTVVVYYYVGGSQSSGAGAVRVGGLPFTVQNVTGNSVQHYASTYNVDNNGTSVFGTSLQATTQIQFYHLASFGAWGALGYPGHVTGTFYLAGQFSYKV